MATISNILIGALSILITFGLAVFVHEFGHMIFALMRGVGVESFAIGMGPKITEWKWHGIEFSLRWIPAGGFVKLKGMAAEEEEEEETKGGEENGSPEASQAAEGGEEKEKTKEKDLTEASYDDMMALNGKGLLTKVMVFGGGVFMNLVTAVLATALLLFIGQESIRIQFDVEKVEPGSLAAEAGLRSGDRVVALDGQPIVYIDQFQKDWDKLWAKAKGPKAERKVDLQLTVKDAAGAERQVDLAGMTPDKLGQLSEGIEYVIPPVIGFVIYHQAADRAGLKENDLVKAIDGQPVHSFTDMSAIIRKSVDKPLKFEIDRGGKTLELTVTPQPDIEDKTIGMIGVRAGSREMVRDRVSNPFKALALAPVLTADRIAMIVDLNVGFFKKATFKEVRENVGGPVAIAAMTVRAAKSGFAGALDWFILLNLLLMIFNLLPLPVLDGGFILLSFIEAVIRRPVPAKVLGPIYSVFVVFLITLMVLISIQDVWNLFTWRH